MKNNRSIEMLLFLILFLTPLLIAPWAYDFFYYPKLLLVQAMSLLILGIHLFKIDRRKIPNDACMFSLSLYCILILISICFSNNLVLSILGKFGRQEGLLALLTYAVLFVFSKTYFAEERKYDKLIGLSAGLVALYGIAQYFGYDPIPRDAIRMFWTGQAFSTMGNSNFLGTYLVLMLPLPIFRFFKESKYIALLISSIIYLCLLLTFARSALLGFAVIMAFILVYIAKRKYLWKKYIALLLVFFSITVFVNEKSEGRLYGRFSSIGNDAQVTINKEENYEKAGSNRIYIWLRTMELIKESPWVGYGLENLDSVFIEKYHDEMIEMYGKVSLVDRAHNEYLHIAVSSGIPALIAYLIFIFFCLKKGYELTKKDIRYLPYLTAASAYLVQAFFNISVVSVAYIFWIFLGIITNEDVFRKKPLPLTPGKPMV